MNICLVNIDQTSQTAFFQCTFEGLSKQQIGA